MQIPVHMIPPEIMEEYNGVKYEGNGFVYFEIVKGAYGLPQEILLANKPLQKWFAVYRFCPAPQTQGLWRNDTHPIQFTLMVDDFVIKYERKEDSQFLLDALNKKYEAVLGYWEGNIFFGINMYWGYENITVDISIPG